MPTNTQTHRHTNTQTHTLTHRHTDTHTQTHRHTQTHTHTHILSLYLSLPLPPFPFPQPAVRSSPTRVCLLLTSAACLHTALALDAAASAIGIITRDVSAPAWLLDETSTANGIALLLVVTACLHAHLLFVCLSCALPCLAAAAACVCLPCTGGRGCCALACAACLRWCGSSSSSSSSSSGGGGGGSGGGGVYPRSIGALRAGTEHSDTITALVAAEGDARACTLDGSYERHRRIRNDLLC